MNEMRPCRGLNPAEFIDLVLQLIEFLFLMFCTVDCVCGLKSIDGTVLLHTWVFYDCVFYALTNEGECVWRWCDVNRRMEVQPSTKSGLGEAYPSCSSC